MAANLYLSLIKYIKYYTVIHAGDYTGDYTDTTSMFSIRSLLVTSAILTIIGVTFANVVARDTEQMQVQEMDRGRIQQKCSG